MKIAGDRVSKHCAYSITLTRALGKNLETQMDVKLDGRP